MAQTILGFPESHWRQVFDRHCEGLASYAPGGPLAPREPVATSVLQHGGSRSEGGSPHSAGGAKLEPSHYRVRRQSESESEDSSTLPGPILNRLRRKRFEASLTYSAGSSSAHSPVQHSPAHSPSGHHSPSSDAGFSHLHPKTLVLPPPLILPSHLSPGRNVSPGGAVIPNRLRCGSCGGGVHFGSALGADRSPSNSSTGSRRSHTGSQSGVEAGEGAAPGSGGGGGGGGSFSTSTSSRPSSSVLSQQQQQQQQVPLQHCHSSSPESPSTSSLPSQPLRKPTLGTKDIAQHLSALALDPATDPFLDRSAISPVPGSHGSSATCSAKSPVLSNKTSGPPGLPRRWQPRESAPSTFTAPTTSSSAAAPISRHSTLAPTGAGKAMPSPEGAPSSEAGSSSGGGSGSGSSSGGRPFRQCAAGESLSALYPHAASSPGSPPAALTAPVTAAEVVGLRTSSSNTTLKTVVSEDSEEDREEAKEKEEELEHPELALCAGEPPPQCEEGSSGCFPPRALPYCSSPTYQQRIVGGGELLLALPTLLASVGVTRPVKFPAALAPSYNLEEFLALLHSMER